MDYFRWIEILPEKIRAINTPNGLYLEDGTKIKSDGLEWQYAKALPEDEVRFVSAIPFLTYPIETLKDIYIVLQGRKEVVVICSQELRFLLEQIPSIYFHQTLKDLKLFCSANNIKFVENYKKTSRI